MRDSSAIAPSIALLAPTLLSQVLMAQDPVPAGEDPFHGNAFAPPEVNLWGLDLQGMIRAGYRAVSVSGNRDRYGVDLRRDPGFRVRDFDLAGAGGFVGFSVAGSHIGDPLYSLEGTVAVGPAILTAAESRQPISIANEGPFPRVDQNRRRRSLDLTLAMPAVLRIAAERDTSEGFFRASVPGQPVPSTAPIPSTASSTPEFGERDLLEVDVIAPLLQFGYRRIDAETRTRWAGVPALGSQLDQRRTQKGDMGYVRLGAHSSPWPWRQVELEFEESASDATDPAASAEDDADDDTLPAGLGIPGVGFPVMLAVEYGSRDFGQTATAGSARGDIDHGSVELGLSLHVGRLIDVPGLTLELEGSIDDYEESGTITVAGIGTGPQAIGQQRQQYAARLRWTDGERFTADLGAGLTRDELEGLQQNAAVGTRAGVVHSGGVEAMVSWKPAERWVIGIGYRGHGDGTLWRTQRWNAIGARGFGDRALDPIGDHRAMDRVGALGAATARYASDAFLAEVHLSHRSSDSDEGLLDLDQKRAAARFSAKPNQDIAIDTLYAFSDIDSRALTHAWFDPDPGLLPNLLAYDGQTHRLAAEVTLSPSAIVDWNLRLGWNRGDGTLAVELWDWSAGVSVDVRYGLRLGVELSGWDYEEAGPGDWDSQMVWVFGEAQIGRN